MAGGAGLPSAAPKTVALVVLWFVLGYIFYSVAFAAVGALVSRQEDLQTAIVPIIVVLTGGFYARARSSPTATPTATLAQIAAFLPPFSPMVVPARMVLGDMSALGLAAAVAIDLLATAGLIVLAARIYERAILRIGAPVKLGRLLGTRSRQTQRANARGAKETQVVRNADTRKAELTTGEPRLSSRAELALRVASVVIVLSGAVIGFRHPLAIVLVAVGLFLIGLDQSLRRWPRRPAE